MRRQLGHGVLTFLLIIFVAAGVFLYYGSQSYPGSPGIAGLANRTYRSFHEWTSGQATSAKNKASQVVSPLKSALSGICNAVNALTSRVGIGLPCGQSTSGPYN